MSPTINFYRKAVTEAVLKCNDADMLDLVWKLLLSTFEDEEDEE